MTAPIDIECPCCKSTAGNYCVVPNGARVTFYHAERIDAAFRRTTLRRDDPRALRAALNEAITRLEIRADLDADAQSFIITTREVFDL